jgi:Autographiviridae endonuclease VII
LTYNKDYYRNNIEWLKPLIRNSHLKRTYGITLEEFDKRLDEQGKVCALCGRGDREFCVDHCHTTLKIRGIICRQCNSGLGQFNDDPNLLEKAIIYLRKEYAEL